MAMNIVVFRHTDCDGIGSLGTTLKACGESYTYINTYLEDFSDFDPLGPDLLIVLGGAPGVYQKDLFPFLKQELAILEKRLAADLPTLGICLGAQLMAGALGANVFKGHQGPEKGWFPITVNEDGMKTPLRHLDGSQTLMMHWHGDTFELPEGATLLASSAKYRHQAFSYGRNALALQCHTEMCGPMFKSWMVGSAGEHAAGHIDIAAIREQAETALPVLMSQSAKFMREWLEQIREVRKVA